jgi:hypothetical protein
MTKYILSIFLSVCTITCFAVHKPVAHSSQSVKAEAFENADRLLKFQTPSPDNIATKDVFWRDFAIAVAAIGLGQILGIWVGASGLNSPIAQPSGLLAVILFIFATVLFLFGIFWLIRAIARKIKSKRKKRKAAD